ncbi:hypothetical protein VULLAG_LOCUS2667 [Vulpes lagopus]
MPPSLKLGATVHLHLPKPLAPIAGLRRFWTSTEKTAPPRFLERPAWRLEKPEARLEALPVRLLFSRRRRGASDPAGLWRCARELLPDVFETRQSSFWPWEET